MSNHQNDNRPPMPEYGTEEYAQWYRENVAPLPTSDKPSHKKRNWIVGIVSVLVVGGVISGIAGGGSEDKAAPKKAAAVQSKSTEKPVEKKQAPIKPVPTEDPAAVSYENYAKALDKFGTTGAMPKSRVVTEAESTKYCDALKLDSDLGKSDHPNFVRAFYSDILSVPLDGTSQTQEGEQIGAMVAGYCGEYLTDMRDAAKQIDAGTN